MSDVNWIKIPPVMLIEVEESADVMQARNTARRAASLLSFNTASRAQIAGAVASLVTIILNAGVHEIVHLHGIKNGPETGLMVRCNASWLNSSTLENATVALRSKLGQMMDEVKLVDDEIPRIEMVLWRTTERRLSERK
jgi:hypothetical protein